MKDWSNTDMTGIEKLLKAGSIEEITAATRALAARKKQLKGVGSVENQAILRGLVAKDGWDAMKVDIAVIRKEQKLAASKKAEADLEGLETEEEENEERAA